MGVSGEISSWAMREIDRLLSSPSDKLPILKIALGFQGDDVFEWALSEIDRLVSDPKERASIFVPQLDVKSRGELYRQFNRISDLLYKDGHLSGNKIYIPSTTGGEFSGYYTSGSYQDPIFRPSVTNWHQSDRVTGSSSALSANVPDAAMMPEVIQWLQSHPVLTVTGVIGTAAAIRKAWDWWTKNTVEGNISFIKRIKFNIFNTQDVRRIIKKLGSSGDKRAIKPLLLLLETRKGIICVKEIAEALQELGETRFKVAFDKIDAICEKYGKYRFDNFESKVQVLLLIKDGYDFQYKYNPPIYGTVSRTESYYEPDDSYADGSGALGTKGPFYRTVEGEGIISGYNLTIVSANRILPPLDFAMSNGGIDIKNIGVEKNNIGSRIKFNDAAMKTIFDTGFEGFTPVFIQMTPIESPLPLFGIIEKTPVVPAFGLSKAENPTVESSLMKEPESAES